MKEKYTKVYLVKSGAGETFPKHSRRKIDLYPGNFVVLILIFMIQISKYVVLFYSKRKIWKSVFGKKCCWGNVSRALQKKKQYFSGKFYGNNSEIYGIN